jgi:hypothetical protein
MLVGNNHMEINQATLMKIVQEWLDRYAPAMGAKVTNVGLVGGTSCSLRVTMEPKPPAKHGPPIAGDVSE